MPGDDWQKFANLRLALRLHVRPSRERSCCSWATNSASGRSGITTRAWIGICLSDPAHAGLQRWVRDLNTLYRGQPALYELDFDAAGFEWVDCNDSQRSVISFLRRGAESGRSCCFSSAISRRSSEQNYRVGVPLGGSWKEILNSDAPLYGGSGQGNFGGLTRISAADPRPAFFAEHDAPASRHGRFPAGGGAAP